MAGNAWGTFTDEEMTEMLWGILMRINPDRDPADTRALIARAVAARAEHGRHPCAWPNGCRPGDKWTCPDCGRRWLAERWDTNADDYLVLVWIDE